MKRLPSWLLAAMLCLGVGLVISCSAGGDDDDDDTGDDDTGDDDTVDDDVSDDDDDDSSDTWTDSTSGLMWQNASDCCYDWDEAKSYCQNLSWGGYSDWRLPTISELRSLIRGCDATETGGSCGVTDSCRGTDCWDDSCYGCEYGEGPGPSGMYWPTELEGDCCRYWSSSPVADYPIHAWGVSFEHGGLNYDYNFPIYGYVRCVR